jgi:hypothetical protein
MWEIVIIAVIVLIAGVLVFAARKPDAFSVQRTTSINAAPEKIFPFIEDFNRWRLWSPYENKDPAMKRTVSGAPSGKGAVYEWDGNSKVGKGRIEIIDASAPSLVTIKARHDQAYGGPQHREFQPGAARRRHASDCHSSNLGHARLLRLHAQGHGPLPRHGQNDRQGLRGRPRQSQGPSGEIGDWLDLAPEDRNEAGTMSWVRRHDEYGKLGGDADECGHSPAHNSGHEFRASKATWNGLGGKGRIARRSLALR